MQWAGAWKWDVSCQAWSDNWRMGSTAVHWHRFILIRAYLPYPRLSISPSLSPLWLQLLWPPGPGLGFPLLHIYRGLLTCSLTLIYGNGLIELSSQIATIRSKHFLRTQNWHLERISVHNGDCNVLSGVKCNLLAAKQWPDILILNAAPQIIVNNGEGGEGVRRTLEENSKF